MDNFAKKHNLRFAILFGSRATGKARVDSDYDVGLLFRRPEDFFTYYDEALNALSELLNAPKEKIDLADLGKENILLRYHVTRVGELLYGNRLDFFQYRAFAFREYLDATKLFDLERLMVERHQRVLANNLATIC